MSKRNSDGSDQMLQNNPTDFVDPNRDMASYYASITTLPPGTQPTFANWLAVQRGQSRTTWNPNYTAEAENSYIQAGFSVSDGSSAAPFVKVLATDSSASEVGPDNGTFTLTRTGDLSNPLTLSSNDYQFGGSATLGTDYALYNSDGVTPFSGSIFPAASGSIQTVSDHREANRRFTGRRR